MRFDKCCCRVRFFAVLAALLWLAACEQRPQNDGLGGPVARVADAPTHGFLGVVFEAERGLTIARVASGSQALQIGDVIQSINGHLLSSNSDAVAALHSAPPGEVVKVGILRGDVALTVDVQLSSYADFVSRLKRAEPDR